MSSITAPPATSPPKAAPQARQAPSRKRPWYKREFYIGRSVKPEIVLNFSRQAASFLGAGIPILEALTIVSEESPSKKMIEVLQDIRRDLSAGASFGDAIALHPKVFPGYYISMVRSAELTGNLDEVLDLLAGYMERDVSARREVKSALIYPCFVLGLAVVAVIVMAAWVLPKFKSLYDSLHANLPLPTRMLLGVTGSLTHWWFAVLGGLVVALAVVYGVIGGAHGKARRDRLLLRLPAVGALVHVIAVERFCRVLAALVSAGVPLPDAVEVSGASTNNRVFQAKLATVREAMMRGQGLARPMSESGLLPAAARQMIRVGEATGSLDRQLATAAVFYERELAYRLKKATDLFEPIVILGVGFVVGFVAVAQVSAIYSIFHQIKP
ncbi:MAG: type II secretion system F family protein [Actinomycetota bacterium]|nr:type II secretion system F family protein [Actinomycetota bacterium]